MSEPSHTAITAQTVLASAEFQRTLTDFTRLPKHWDAHEVIDRMLEDNDPNARQTEWIGFGTEAMARRISSTLRFPGCRFGNMQFDATLSLGNGIELPVDLKAHSIVNAKGKPAPYIIANDKEGVDLAIETYGGLILAVVNGTPTYDTNDRVFDTWHRAFRGCTTPATAKSRKLKTKFHVQTISFYLITKENKGNLGIFKQGRQQDGSPRRLKYKLDTRTFTPIHTITL